MTSTLLIVQIFLSVAITISVLLQKSSSIGLGAYSGSNESMFGAKGPMGFLAKLTFTLAILFVVNTLALGYLYTKNNNKSVVDSIKSIVPLSPEKVSPIAPTAPVAPSTQVADAPTVPPSPAEVAVKPEENTTVDTPTVVVPETPAVVKQETPEENATDTAPLSDADKTAPSDGNATTQQ